MRLMLIVVTVAVATLLDLRVSQATQMPWCAGTNTGDFFHYNCTLPTYEMCVQEVIARAGGDRRQPRILQSEPELPRARIRSAQGQAEAIVLLIHAAQRLGSVAATRQGPPRHPVQRTHRGRRPDHLRPRLQDGTRRHRVETQGLTLPPRSLAGLVEDEKPGVCGGEARGRRRVGR